VPRRSGASVAVAGGGGGGVDSSVTVLPRPRSLTRFKILAYYRCQLPALSASAPRVYTRLLSGSSLTVLRTSRLLQDKG